MQSFLSEVDTKWYYLGQEVDTVWYNVEQMAHFVRTVDDKRYPLFSQNEIAWCHAYIEERLRKERPNLFMAPDVIRTMISAARTPIDKPKVQSRTREVYLRGFGGRNISRSRCLPKSN